MSESATHPSAGESIVVGLYGLPGCGKTFLIDQLKLSPDLGEEHFAYYDGSAVLSSLLAGGLAEFKQMDDQQKYRTRERAIRVISAECASSGRVGVVAGHLLFWDEHAPAQLAWTAADASVYTHIFFLDVPSEEVAKRRLGDTVRARPPASLAHLEKWASAEQSQLREICLENGILFTTTSPSKVAALLRDVQCHTEAYNLDRAEEYLDSIVSTHKSNSNSVLVLDGDRTLIPDDTGALFDRLMLERDGTSGDGPLKSIFKSSLGYSYTAFRQVAFMYSGLEQATFDEYCRQVASSVTVYPEFVMMLQRAAGVAAVVVTCGLRAIWERIIDRAGLSETVKVVGGGRLEDGFVVTADVKAALVARLQDVHGKYVCAFGDSILDLPMLKVADRAVVVVGEEGKRSRAMERALARAVEEDGFLACQVILPPTTSPRLDSVRLPLVDITSEHFLASILSPVVLAPANVARLLMTPMRDAAVSGPHLRKAHESVGRYLAVSLLSASECIGLEEYSIRHVQGHETTGYRFRDEARTTIVALMRGGEPMALGVNEVMPLAMFVHAKLPSDLKAEYVEGQRTIILVDSVINTGTSIVGFVARIREVDACIRIVVVAGVVQAKSFSRTALARVLTADRNFVIVALRQSDNKFTGKGTTDTGNRLFNTTRLD
ncbi:unnamed protein product [Rhizoctonia solani]|uniref:Phosphoribosyltransferase domain-containing protein n=1 Tax=Rhizoctonia solani TaxID=456999 RepID=A0A8H3DSG8_9AGAM|nr:unnamed protein product [Rhizoctonia solani]